MARESLLRTGALRPPRRQLRWRNDLARMSPPQDPADARREAILHVPAHDDSLAACVQRAYLASSFHSERTNSNEQGAPARGCAGRDLGTCARARAGRPPPSRACIHALPARRRRVALTACRLPSCRRIDPRRTERFVPQRFRTSTCCCKVSYCLLWVKSLVRPAPVICRDG